MKKIVFTAFAWVFCAGSFAALDAAEAHGWRASGAYGASYAGPRRVYWVYRSPRYIPPPPAPESFSFLCSFTNRVNTHMY